MPELSIIIPVAGRQEEFENTLVSILENRPEDCEVVVVRDERYDDPYALADEVTFVDIDCGASLVERFTVGVARSRAELIHVMSGTVRATPDWTLAALQHFRQRRVAAVVPVLYDARRPSRIVAAGVELTAGGRRRVRRRVPPCEADAAGATASSSCTLAAPLAGAFFRKSAYQLVGGLDSLVGDDLADVDFAARLRHAGYLTVVEPEARLLYVGRWRGSAVRHTSGRDEERLFWRHAAVVGWWRALWQHPWAVTRRLLDGPLPWQAAAHLAGRIVALTEIHRYGAHYRRLAEFRDLAATMDNAAAAPSNEGRVAGRRVDTGRPAAQRARRREPSVRPIEGAATVLGRRKREQPRPSQAA